MLEINMPLGNMFLDGIYEHLQHADCERLLVSRMEMDRRILRRETDRGTDIGINLDPGIRLRGGDVLRAGGSPIVVEQLPETVLTLRTRLDDPSALILIGHIIGNRHRPVHVDQASVTFPIQDRSEAAVFEDLFRSVTAHMELNVAERVFIPSPAGGAHGH